MLYTIHPASSFKKAAKVSFGVSYIPVKLPTLETRFDKLQEINRTIAQAKAELEIGEFGICLGRSFRKSRIKTGEKRRLAFFQLALKERDNYRTNARLPGDFPINNPSLADTLQYVRQKANPRGGKVEQSRFDANLFSLICYADQYPETPAGKAILSLSEHRLKLHKTYTKDRYNQTAREGHSYQREHEAGTYHALTITPEESFTEGLVIAALHQLTNPTSRSQSTNGSSSTRVLQEFQRQRELIEKAKLNPPFQAPCSQYSHSRIVDSDIENLLPSNYSLFEKQAVMKMLKCWAIPISQLYHNTVAGRIAHHTERKGDPMRILTNTYLLQEFRLPLPNDLKEQVDRELKVLKR